MSLHRRANEEIFEILEDLPEVKRIGGTSEEKLEEDKLLETKKFLEILEDHDDVQKIYSNLEMLG